MRKTTFRIPETASISLTSVLRRQSRRLRVSAAAHLSGFRGGPAEAAAEEAVRREDLVAVLVQAADPDAVLQAVADRSPEERLDKLGGGFLSALVRVDTAATLVRQDQVQRVQTKKLSAPRLGAALPDIGLVKPDGTRLVKETGKGVLIGVVDSGFDLSHPMFRDPDGKLRVDALLDQKNGHLEYTTQQLETAWTAGPWVGPGSDSRAGADLSGHGTHVASIAGGSRYADLEGVAPGARFLLVRTDFVNTDRAVQWVFSKAGATPCVVNLSLGHHWGAHDGSDAEEELHQVLTGPGKVIVASAGNERADNLHLGGWFVPEQVETVTFDVLRQPDGSAPVATVNLFYPSQDVFDVELVNPSGQALGVPTQLNTSDAYQAAELDLELGRKAYAPTALVQVQISLAFRTASVANQALRGWQLRLTCRTAAVGRLDGWVNNSGYAEFRPHPLVKPSRTVGLPATGRACLAVASHVSKTAWLVDAGDEKDARVLAGRSSPFSSQGPTRDGRWKPDLSAPGQYVTAALSARSRLAVLDQRVQAARRLLTIEGTSMSAPVVTGAVALLLQKKGTLTPDQVREVLTATARHDAQTGPAAWNPAYGYGKLDIVAALQRV